MNDQEEMQKAIEALVAALPNEKRLQLVSFKPQVGFGDAEAGTVQAFVIADSDEDLKRAAQIIEKGIRASQEEYGLTAHFRHNAPIIFDPAMVTRINPIESIKDDADYVMSMLEQMTEIELSPEQKELAKAIALREADKGEVNMLTAVEAFEAEPTLATFGAKLRKVAWPGVYGKLFDSSNDGASVLYLDEAKYLLNEGRRIGAIDSPRKE